MASTPTLALRKLIQTKLNPDDDASSVEDSASSYEDDLRNPLKRRLAAWLTPNQARRGSTASAVQVRNSSEWLPSPSLPVYLTGHTPSIVSLHNPPPHASSDGADPRMESQDVDRAANDGTLPTIPGEVPTTWFGTAHDYDLDVDQTSYQQDSLPQNPAPLTSTYTSRRLVRMPSFSSTFSSSSLDSDYHHQHSHPHQSINQHAPDTSDTSGQQEDAQQRSQNQSEMSMTFLYTPSPSPLPVTPDMLFMGSGDQTPNMNANKSSKDWSDGARQLMLETEQAFASDSAFDATSFELRLPSLLSPKAPAEDDADTTIHAEQESEESQQDDKDDVEKRSMDTQRSSPRRPGTATETKANAEETVPTTVTAPALASAPAPADDSSPPPDVPPKDSSSVQPSSPPRPAWRPQDTSTTTRRSTEQQDEMETRRSRQYENVIQSEKRKSRSVPPPLPPRDNLLAPAAQGALPPTTPSPKTTSFNVTPAVSASPSSKPAPAASKPLHSFNQARSQSKFDHGGRRPSRITRWAFGDRGVADILTGNRFKKIEADEMLTPQQLAKLKKQREEIRRQAELESSRAAEHKRLAEMERQVEKSSSESERSLSSSPGNRDSGSSLPIYISVPEKSPRRFSAQRLQDIGDEDDEDLMDGLATVDLLGTSSTRTSFIPPGSPIPPGPLSPPPTGELPRVPRFSARRSKALRKRRTPTSSLKPEEDDECYYLKSTPYSLTSPTFRHGHISFSKSEMGKGALTMDDTLDWTAFQMAILGAGDMMPEVYDDEDPRFNEEVFRWFDSFGFDSYGSLVPETAPSPRSSSHSTVSTAPTEASIPALAMGESPNMWQDGSKGEMYDTNKFFSNNGRPGWTIQGSSLAPGHARSNSATCDPLLPIVLTPEDGYEDGLIPMEERPGTGKGEDCENSVPMACNMNSDLDDFLKWEAQHAFGPGYYGAH